MGDRRIEHADQLSWGTREARGAVLATVLGSGLTFLAGTSINVALPALADELDAGISTLQWTVNAYTLTLAALVLVGGSLGDRFGRRRVFVVGTVWLAVTSLLCGLAWDATSLIVARALQGIGAALLTPASLAILQASFRPGDRARAVGAWSGLAGIAAAVGPLLGGLLVEAWTWRLIFLINVPLAAVVVVAAMRYLPETGGTAAAPRLDLVGAALAAVGLAVVTWALTDAGERGLSPVSATVGVAGVVTLVVFVLVERRSSHPMMPPDIFASRQFTGANLVTFAVYAVLGGAFFLITLQLQLVLGYAPVAAGAAALPITLLMLLLSARAGALAERIGPRLPMTIGPLVIAVGLLLLTGLDADSDYLTGVLPGVTVLGLGLAGTVAPLTATVLAATSPRLVGVASGVNNAVSRAAGLLAVAALPALAGLSGESVEDPAAFSDGFGVAMVISAGVAALGGLLAWATIRNQLVHQAQPCPATQLDSHHHCPLDGPPAASAADASRAGAASS